VLSPVPVAVDRPHRRDGARFASPHFTATACCNALLSIGSGAVERCPACRALRRVEHAGVDAASMLPLSLQDIRSMGRDEPGDCADDERATLLSL
jgi:hypothetical protein